MFLKGRGGGYFSHVGATFAEFAGIQESRIRTASRLSLLLLDTTTAAEIAPPPLSLCISHATDLLSEQFSQLGNFTVENQAPETFPSFLLASFCADVSSHCSAWPAFAWSYVTPCQSWASNRALLCTVPACQAAGWKRPGQRLPNAVFRLNFSLALAHLSVSLPCVFFRI